MNEAKLTNEELVNQAIQAVTGLPPEEDLCLPDRGSNYGLVQAHSNVANSLRVLAFQCPGTLGDLLNGVIDMANEEWVEANQDRHFWRDHWREQSEQATQLRAQRDALVAEVLALREIEANYWALKESEDDDLP